MAKKKATKKKSRKKAPKRRRPTAAQTRAKQAEVRRLFPDETGDIMASWIGLEQENPSADQHSKDASEYMGRANESLMKAREYEAAGLPDEAHGLYVTTLTLSAAAGAETVHTKGLDSARRIGRESFREIREKAREGMARTCRPKDNPNTTEHRETAQKLSQAAAKALNSAESSRDRGRPWEEEFNSYLNALVWAMAAHREAEYGMPKRKEGRRQRKGARRMAWSVESTERRVLQIAESAIRALRHMVVMAGHEGRGEGFLAAGDQSASSNPANIPGGNMTDCIAIMEARGDVESPGALCNWLSQKAGERRGPTRSASRAGRRKKVSDALRRAMRGT